MRTRTLTCRSCGRPVLTSAPPVADEVPLCPRCAARPLLGLDPTRPVTVCRDAPGTAQDALRLVRAA